MADPHHIHILLAACNGADFIDEQLQSFAAQNHQNWSLVVSLDPSTDNSAEIVTRFAGQVRQSVRLKHGAGRGHAANFMDLLRGSGQTAPAGAMVGFSDQDDAWLPEKLSSAARYLGAVDSSVPALYCSRSWATDRNLAGRKLVGSCRLPATYRNALIQNISQGNTIVMNAAAHRLAIVAASRVDAVVFHDWWLYQMIAGAGGLVLRDPEPRLLYRQHGSNAIGANLGWSAKVKRARMLLKGTHARWNDINIRAQLANADLLSEENRDLLLRFAALRRMAWPQRLTAFIGSGLHRQTFGGTFATWIACTIGRF